MLCAMVKKQYSRSHYRNNTSSIILSLLLATSYAGQQQRNMYISVATAWIPTITTTTTRTSLRRFNSNPAFNNNNNNFITATASSLITTETRSTKAKSFTTTTKFMKPLENIKDQYNVQFLEPGLGGTGSSPCAWRRTTSNTRLFASNNNRSYYGSNYNKASSSSASSSFSSSSSWKVPKTITIPEQHPSIEFSFVRSSGSGGQNVNKVNTQVQVRMHLPTCTDWLPNEVITRVQQQQSKRINKKQELILKVQEYRTQAANRKAAIDKIKEILLQAWPRPKIRNQRTGISIKTKEQRKDFKRKRSLVKENRRRVDY